MRKVRFGTEFWGYLTILKWMEHNEFGRWEDKNQLIWIENSMAETLELFLSRLELLGPQQQPIYEKSEIWD